MTVEGKSFSQKEHEIMKIGISCRIDEEESYNEVRNSLSVDWISYFNSLKYDPIIIPCGLSNINEYLNNFDLDGIILSGGNNINPKLYHSDYKMDSVYEFRDSSEFDIINYALKNKLPLLGVCRGMSIINIYFNGSLTHNIKNHVNINHKLVINKFLDYFDKEIFVNSFHNHGIKSSNLGSNLNVFAKSEDGFIEGIYNLDKLIFGVQWHPERDPRDEQFDYFLNNFFKKNII